MIMADPSHGKYGLCSPGELEVSHKHVSTVGQEYVDGVISFSATTVLRYRPVGQPVSFAKSSILTHQNGFLL